MPEVVTAPAVTSGGKLRNNNIATCLLLQPHQRTEDQEDVNTRFWLTPTQTQDCCVAGWISAVPICTAFSFLSLLKDQLKHLHLENWFPPAEVSETALKQNPVLSCVSPSFCSSDGAQFAPFCNFKYQIFKFQKNPHQF